MFLVSYSAVFKVVDDTDEGLRNLLSFLFFVPHIEERYVMLLGST